MGMKKGIVGAALLGLSLSCATTVQAAGLDGLLPHRAVYDLSLKDASDRSGITDMSGRVVYEMTGSKCDGFAVRFRFLTRVETARKNFTSDQRATTFESGDGSSLDFINQSYLNGQLEKELRGKAVRKGNVVEVAITQPSEESVELDSAIFTTDHIGKLIDAARKGETIVTAKVFDGSDDGDELVETTAIIGKKKSDVGKVDGEADDVAGSFEGKDSWPVSVSYFSTSNVQARGEKLPIYQVSFLMYESGVSRKLTMQYDDYALKGDLKKIEYLKSSKCK